MGGPCAACPEPDTTNQCTDEPIPGPGDPHIHWEVPGFCAQKTLLFKNLRDEYCDMLGGNEWVGDGLGSNCKYIFNNNHVECCPGCGFGCTTGGAGDRCKRIAYRGDKATCCQRDYNFLAKDSGETVFCFDTSSREFTCDPAFRDATNENCRETMLDFCTGADLDRNDTSWLDRWKPDSTSRDNCSYVLSRNLYGSALPMFDNIIQYPPESYTDNAGFSWSRELMQRVFEKYQSQGFRIGTIPGLPGYNSFQDVILNPLCTTAPGICQEGLNTTCSNTTVNDLLRDPALVPWCGCYMPSDQYQKYVDQDQVEKPCTPMCARQGNIPVMSADGRQTVLCNQSVCIIDNVTISLENSNVGGGINFSQFCGGCSAPVSGVNGTSNDTAGTGSQQASSCLCIISDATIAAASSDIGGGINLSENCGSNPQCFKQNPTPGDGNPSQLPIDCNGPPDQNPYADIGQDEPSGLSFQTWVIIILVIIGVFVVILFMLYLSRHGNDSDDKIIPRIDTSNTDATTNAVSEPLRSDPNGSSSSIYSTPNRHPEFQRLYDTPQSTSGPPKSIYDT
jgi:uncharacterized protein DUF5857